MSPMMQSRSNRSYLAAALACAACVSAAVAQDQVPLIPRESLFGNPDRAGVQVSPDGRMISYRAAVDGVMNVWVSEADDLSRARSVTRDTRRGIRSYFWAHTSKHILYTQDKGGDENWHLYAVDVAGGKEIDLTPFDGVQARVQQVSPDHPDEVLVAINNRNPRLHDIYRVNIITGERTLVAQNDEGYVGYISDEDFKLHFAIKSTSDGGMEMFRAVSEGSWTSFARISQEDSLTTQPLALDQARTGLYMLDSRGRNTAALTLVDIAGGSTRLLAEDPKSDIQNVLMHPTEHRVQAVQANYTKPVWRVLDDAITADFKKIRQVSSGEFSITSRSQDDRHWIVVFQQDDGPARYYHYDRPHKAAKFLFTNRNALENTKLAKMHPVVVRARDGLDLVCYYTLPLSSDPDGDGKVDQPMPLVLLVHGGPWARDGWGFHPHHQWLANRGYAVMSVNYRGSTGFGKNFINAADKAWATAMHNDLLDAVDWAVKSGIADSDKVAIMGGSYGGYATLVGLTFTPERFACGVDIVGPSNLITLLETIPPYWEPMINIFTKRVGDHRTEEGRKLLIERSPLTHVDKIKRPLLIGQGANDPRVKQSESDQIVEAMQNKSIPVTYALFPDEGHGFARPQNSMAFHAVAEVFLGQHLGGRYEPLSVDMLDSSITVPTGAQDIPGLNSLLQRRKADPTQ